MKFLFLIKAGNQYGLGHYTRSKSLALHLTERGHTVFFWIVGESMDLGEDFDLVVQSLSEHAELFIEILHQKEIDILYVDGNFKFDESLFSKIKKTATVVFYQNLTGSMNKCDIFISPYPADKRVEPLRHASEVTLYEGFEYYIIRDEVLKWPKDTQSNQPIRDVIITTGGSDPKHLMEEICQKIDFSSHNELTFTALTGASFQKKRVQELKKTFRFSNLKFVPFSLGRMLGGDFVISALGVTVFELLYLNIPVACIAMKNTADTIGQYLTEYNLSTYLGFYGELNEKTVNQFLQHLLQREQHYRTLAERAGTVIDGKAVVRITNLLGNIQNHG